MESQDGELSEGEMYNDTGNMSREKRFDKNLRDTITEEEWTCLKSSLLNTLTEAANELYPADGNALISDLIFGLSVDEGAKVLASCLNLRGGVGGRVARAVICGALSREKVSSLGPVGCLNGKDWTYDEARMDFDGMVICERELVSHNSTPTTSNPSKKRSLDDVYASDVGQGNASSFPSQVNSNRDSH